MDSVLFWPYSCPKMSQRCKFFNILMRNGFWRFFWSDWRKMQENIFFMTRNKPRYPSDWKNHGKCCGSLNVWGQITISGSVFHSWKWWLFGEPQLFRWFFQSDGYRALLRVIKNMFSGIFLQSDPKNLQNPWRIKILKNLHFWGQITIGGSI